MWLMTSLASVPPCSSPSGAARPCSRIGDPPTSIVSLSRTWVSSAMIFPRTQSAPHRGPGEHQDRGKQAQEPTVHGLLPPTLKLRVLIRPIRNDCHGNRAPAAVSNCRGPRAAASPPRARRHRGQGHRGGNNDSGGGGRLGAREADDLRCRGGRARGWGRRRARWRSSSSRNPMETLFFKGRSLAPTACVLSGSSAPVTHNGGNVRLHDPVRRRASREAPPRPHRPPLRSRSAFIAAPAFSWPASPDSGSDPTLTCHWMA
jgi:hypothetical protein